MVLAEVMPEERTRSGAWLAGLVSQHHPRLGERLAAFLAIARGARADNILPEVRAAAMTRHHVVNRQVIRLNAAVLANEIVAAKNGAARERHAQSRAVHLIRQANHGGTRKFHRRRVNVAATVDDDFRLAADEEDNRASSLTHVQRFVILVENENVLAHH